jgi:hypothetical protein
MLVFAASVTERLKYILDEVLLHRLGVSYSITDKPVYFSASQSPKINYNTTLLEGCVNIPAQNLLFDEQIIPQKLQVETHITWKKVFYQNSYISIPDFKSNTAVLPFDLLAASFYLLSRYEEYLGTKTDEHNRFKAENSIAFQYDFLDYPLVDFWVQTLGKQIQKCYPNIRLNPSNFKQVNTIDIDFAYKYKGLSLAAKWRKTIGSILRNKPDYKAFNPPQKDPYDTYDFLLETPNAKGIETLFFFLLADYGKHDLNLSPKSAELKNLIQNLQQKNTIGIHPSYKGSLIGKLYQKEHAYFKLHSGQDARLSRHHFLKIKIPQSYIKMQKMGITHDYSMAYSKHLGFRASTAKPFKFYDLAQEKTLEVWVHSPCLMDVTLKNALKLSVEQSKIMIKQYKEICQSLGGEFISIWHNSNFDPTENWENWDEVYLSLFE